MLGWALAAGIGAIAGAIIAQYRNVLDFNFMGAVLLFGFAAGVRRRVRLDQGRGRRRTARRHRRDVRPGAVHVRRQRAVARDGAVRDPHRAVLPTAGAVRIEDGWSGYEAALPRSSSKRRGSPCRTAPLQLLGVLALVGVLPRTSSTCSRTSAPSAGPSAVTLGVAILGLNIVTGYSGQISVGHSAFFGIGAYTTMILVADHGWPFLATLPVAGALGFAVGFVIGIPALRIRGLYLVVDHARSGPRLPGHRQVGQLLRHRLRQPHGRQQRQGRSAAAT